MKFTAEQIKTFVKKTAKGNSTISQITIRNYIMERFLERLSLSEFKNKFILKGGLLIASIVGLDTSEGHQGRSFFVNFCNDKMTSGRY